MIQLEDLYTYVEQFPLEDAGTAFGTLHAEYHVQRYVNVTNLACDDQYVLTCRTRIAIPNSAAIHVGPHDATAYENYPAVLRNKVQVRGAEGTTLTARLREYSPRTLNSSVSTDSSTASGQQQGATHQYTRGSSSAETNSFQFSPMQWFNPTLSSSSTHEHSSSSTSGSSSLRTQQSTAGTEMSIKDWSALACVEGEYARVGWIWSQEYPWDTLQYDAQDSNGNAILPPFVAERLYDGTYLYPPSQLSEGGIDVSAGARWEIDVAAGPPALEVAHEVDYVTGTHQLQQVKGKAQLTARLNHSAGMPFTHRSGALQLAQLALDPVSSGRTAAVNVLGDPFRIPPTPQAPFAVLSRTNTLLLSGSGFAPSMVADLTKGSASLDLTFKITDQRAHRLIMKHWKGSGGDACLLTLHMPDGTILEKTVDADESAGGESNLTQIALRDNAYSSLDYHDYLALGTNTIHVEVTPAEAGASACSYQLVALAVV